MHLFERAAFGKSDADAKTLPAVDYIRVQVEAGIGAGMKASAQIASPARGSETPDGDKFPGPLSLNTLSLVNGQNSSIIRSELPRQPSDKSLPEITFVGLSDRDIQARLLKLRTASGVLLRDAPLTPFNQQTVTLLKDGTLNGLCDRTLGPTATEAQREAFLKAVRSLNDMRPDIDNVARGQNLKLPGLNNAGDFTYSENGMDRRWSATSGRMESRRADESKTVSPTGGETPIIRRNGDKVTTVGDTTLITKPNGTTIKRDSTGEYTLTQDGLAISRNRDGSLKDVHGNPYYRGTHQKLDDGDGGTVDRARGTRPESNFTLVQSKDGRMEVAHKEPDGKDRISTLMQDKSVEPERRAMMERVERFITDPEELAKFRADMVCFESRAKERGLKPDQVTGTYKAIGRMLDGGSAKQLSQGDRNILAQQVMNNAAHPTSIDQGQHNTCTVTAIETNIYTKDPEIAAALVSEVALTRSFKAKGDTIVRLNDESLKPDLESRSNPPRDGGRSFASQIFQVTAVNAYYAQRTLPWRYEQTDVANRNDTGERLRLWGVPTWEQPALNSDAIVKTHELITGRKDADLLLVNNRFLFLSPNIFGFSSSKVLGDKLSEMQRDGKFPAIITVNTFNPPFSQKEGGWHVVSVTGYNATTGEVKIDNQWGSKNDRIGKPVPLKELFGATLSPRELANYQLRNG